MQKIVVFIENDFLELNTPSKIGNLFLNRFAIEEEANTEVLKIFKIDFEICQNGSVQKLSEIGKG